MQRVRRIACGFEDLAGHGVFSVKPPALDPRDFGEERERLLRDDGISEGAEPCGSLWDSDGDFGDVRFVQPGVKPISHSTQAGFRLPPAGTTMSVSVSPA